MGDGHHSGASKGQQHRGAGSREPALLRWAKRWRMPSGQHGFSLLEIAVGVALMGLLAVAVTPIVMGIIEGGRKSRTGADVEAIAKAVQGFRVDTGFWPKAKAEEAASPGAGTLELLVSDPLKLPTPSGADSEPWLAAGPVAPGARFDTFTNQLNLNSIQGTTNRYPEAKAGERRKDAWRGPYITGTLEDPWGRAYLINVRFLKTTQANVREDFAVYVCSAGPDGVLQIPFQQRLDANPLIPGDDICMRLQ